MPRPTTGNIVRIIKGTSSHSIPLTTICEIIEDWGEDHEFPYELRNKETEEIYDSMVAEDEVFLVGGE